MTTATNTPTCTICGNQELIFDATAKFNTSTCEFDLDIAETDILPQCPECTGEVDWVWQDIKPGTLADDDDDDDIATDDERSYGPRR
jgi:hypothetical protein